MGFSDPILGSGGVLVRQAMLSDNYVAGSAGWRIARDGTAEFSGVTVRGAVVASSFATDVAPNDRIEITSADLGDLVFYAQAATDPGLRLRSFLNNGQSEYIGAVEGPDNHPTQGRPYLYFLTDDGSVSSSDVGVQAGIVSGSALTILGTGLARLAAPNGATFLGVSVAAGIDVVSDGGAIAITTDDGAGTSGSIDVYTNGGAISILAGGGGTVSIGDVVAQYTSGTESAPAYTFVGDEDTGIYRNGANDVVITAGGTSIGQFQLASGFNAYVGFTTQSGCFATFLDRMFAPGMNTTTAGGLVVERFPTSGNELYGETSSRALKADLGPMPAGEYVGKLLAAPLRSWTAMNRYADGTTEVTDPKRLGRNRGQTWDRPGWVADEMAAVFPEATVFDDDGVPVGIDKHVVLVTLVAAVKGLTGLVADLQRQLGSRP